MITMPRELADLLLEVVSVYKNKKAWEKGNRESTVWRG
jgi:hypothetical protein